MAPDKLVLQEGVDRGAAIRLDSTRQRHVKAELLDTYGYPQRSRFAAWCWLSPAAKRRLLSDAVIGRRNRSKP